MITLHLLELAWVMAAVGGTAGFVCGYDPNDPALPAMVGAILGFACFAIYSPVRTTFFGG